MIVNSHCQCRSIWFVTELFLNNKMSCRDRRLLPWWTGLHCYTSFELATHRVDTPQPWKKWLGYMGMGSCNRLPRVLVVEWYRQLLQGLVNYFQAIYQNNCNSTMSHLIDDLMLQSYLRIPLGVLPLNRCQEPSTESGRDFSFRSCNKELLMGWWRWFAYLGNTCIHHLSDFFNHGIEPLVGRNGHQTKSKRSRHLRFG